ncbi:hypothetical protein THASP1DRAFT_31440 [Thamnocephalis sphaerospora]|uniref:Uncharacterized protein n=1 Tax=Thamnocephalis sphaerospora TaxID=78915 RepID=A0A4P9XLJ8_9FUNG|nr:hypothetical protein THASP1DRAFT_31440 [Thamnocephalis sphaerospora]|eukprot:RKP06747.1 hypothetical protein THASP1DRAFT_31440 [Thamnocephalis sphaerospora]
MLCHAASAPVKAGRRQSEQQRKQTLRSKLASAFKTTGDGRMLIDDKGDKEDMATHHNNDVSPTGMVADGAEGNNYYLETKQSREGYTRVGNRIKFNKRGANAESFVDDSDDEPSTERPAADGKGHGRKAVPTIGKAFRSKKAGGDVKRANQPDPYAYIPLNPLALKKRGPRAKLAVSITGKRGGKVQKRRA